MIRGYLFLVVHASVIVNAVAADLASHEVSYSVQPGTHRRASPLQIHEFCRQIPNCPCDVAAELYAECAVFLGHVQNRHPKEEQAYVEARISGSVAEDCMKTSMMCTVSNTTFGHDYTLLDTFEFYPCERKLTITSAYTYPGPNDNKPTIKNYNVDIVEGKKELILTHPIGASDLFFQYLTVYFKDVWVKNEETDYKTLFSVKMFWENIRDSTDAQVREVPYRLPQWRHVSYEPVLSECGKCPGGIGCTGNETSAIILLSLLITILTILYSCYMMTRSFPPAASVGERPTASP